MNVRRFFGIAILTVALVFGCGSESFTVEFEPSGTKVLKGFFHRKDIEQDTLFAWFKPNYSSYRPDSASLSEMKSLVDDIHFVLIVGTWCGDSKREVPKIYKVLDALDISNSDIVMFGVDRSKQSKDGTTDKFNVHRVPTLLVFRGEQELGRIVENPRESQEKDLLRILRK